MSSCRIFRLVGDATRNPPNKSFILFKASSQRALTMGTRLSKCYLAHCQPRRLADLHSRPLPAGSSYLIHVRAFSIFRPLRWTNRRSTVYVNRAPYRDEPPAAPRGSSAVEWTFFAVFAIFFWAWNTESWVVNRPQELTKEEKRLYLSMLERNGLKSLLPQHVLDPQSTKTWTSPFQRPQEVSDTASEPPSFANGFGLLRTGVLKYILSSSPDKHKHSPIMAPVVSAFRASHWPPKTYKRYMPYFLYQFSHLDAWHFALNMLAFRSIARTGMTYLGPLRFTTAFLVGGFGSANLTCVIERQLNGWAPPGKTMVKEWLQAVRIKSWNFLLYPMPDDLRKSALSLKGKDGVVEARRWTAANMGASGSLVCMFTIVAFAAPRTGFRGIVSLLALFDISCYTLNIDTR